MFSLKGKPCFKYVIGPENDAKNKHDHDISRISNLRNGFNYGDILS